MPADTDRLEVYEAGDGWRWRRIAGNNRILCTGEAHTRQEDAHRAALRACPDLDPAWHPTPPVVDTAPLDLIKKLLDPGDDDDLDDVRSQLEAHLP